MFRDKYCALFILAGGIIGSAGCVQMTPEGLGLSGDVPDEVVDTSPLVGASTGLDYPSAKTNWISLQAEIQGVAHDSGHWYISNNSCVVQVPLGEDLNDISFASPSFLIPNDLAPRWNHMGDPDFWNGSLYVPIEANNGGGDPVVSIVDPATMKEKNRLLLPPIGIPSGECPWVAVDPKNGLLTTATFDIRADAGKRIRAFSMAPQLDGTVKPVIDHTVVLADSSGSIDGAIVEHGQGAAYSSQGHMYIISDANDGDAPPCQVTSLEAIHLGCHGLYAFGPEENVPAGAGVPSEYGVPVKMRRLLYFTPVQRQIKSLGAAGTALDLSQEIEGLDVFELAPGKSPGISGKVHLFMSHADAQLQRSFWFKHYDTSGPSVAW